MEHSIDREKVIKGLEYCIADEYCDDCPYTDDCFAIDDKPYGDQLMRDALSLLKEQGMQKFFVDESGKVTPLPVVVRCKDCRHCTFSDGEQLADCMIKQGWFPVKPDWFCADGERK